jgi:hypothetical protein
MANKGGDMTNASTAMPTRRVEMLYAGTAPQNRLTVAFRVILAIPQFIILYILFIASLFVLVIGWFAALFTGQLPQWAHTFLGGVVRWSARVGAYMFLLTDSYPPFSFDDVEYPARPVLPDRGPLNRVSVFFRIILAIPAGVFLEIVVNGLTFPLLFIMWIVVLITGSMPPALYDPYSVLLRYQVRFNAWFSMLTSEYAWGMLGDTVVVSTGYTPPPFVPPVVPPAAGPTAAGAPGSPPPAPPAQPFSYPSAPGAPGEQAATPPADAAPPAPPPGWPPPQPASPGSPPGAMPPPSQWERTSTPSPQDVQRSRGTLILQGAARSWMIFAIVWGSIVFVGQIARDAAGGNRHTTSEQVNTVNARTPPPAHVGVQAGADR